MSVLMYTSIGLPGIKRIRKNVRVTTAKTVNTALSSARRIGRPYSQPARARVEAAH
jgi:hypothetical protein